MGTNVNGTVLAGWKVWGAVLGVLTAVGISGTNWIKMNRDVAVGDSERTTLARDIDRNEALLVGLVKESAIAVSERTAMAKRMNGTEQVLGEVVKQALANEQTVARIDERLRAVQNSLERIEKRLEEKLK